MLLLLFKDLFTYLGEREPGWGGEGESLEVE